MKTFCHALYILSLLALFMVFWISSVYAQEGVGTSLDLVTVNPISIRGGSVFSAKFLCGAIPHDTSNPQNPSAGYPLVPGTYLTTINVHNVTNSNASFTKSAVISNPQGQPPGAISEAETEDLGPMKALQVDCENIRSLLGEAGSASVFLQGFLVINTQADLNVVGVYTVKNVLPEATTPAPTCGDGNVDPPGEECDDGNTNAGDGCSPDCTIETATCGNGVPEPGEECDDGNTNDNDACLSTCVFAACGDGILQIGVEQCDDGVANSDTLPDACRTNCTNASCGDGVKDASEQCDGSDLDGFTCLEFIGINGVLACYPSCTFDVTGCTVGVPP